MASTSPRNPGSWWWGSRCRAHLSKLVLVLPWHSIGNWTQGGVSFSQTQSYVMCAFVWRCRGKEGVRKGLWYRRVARANPLFSARVWELSNRRVWMFNVRGLLQLQTLLVCVCLKLLTKSRILFYSHYIVKFINKNNPD